MNNSIISILIPVYNVEQYLPRCIESVLSQDFQDWEMILVDDGSPDRCPQICDEYAEKDKRIRVVHKVNGGLVSASLSCVFLGFLERLKVPFKLHLSQTPSQPCSFLYSSSILSQPIRFIGLSFAF